MRKLYLIDGSGFIFRAYYALPALERHDGTPVNAVLGFCNMLIRLHNEVQAVHAAVIFDAARKTFRNDLYPDYKSHRPELPEDMKPQFPLVRDAARAFGFPAIELPGYEADDLIAAYATAALAQGWEAVIVSSDKDLMQLIRPGVSMYDPIKNKPVDEARVFEKFGVGPDRVADVQALIGDSADNVPGAPGIGMKTAALLINEYGSLENLLLCADQMKAGKRRDVLLEHADLIRLSHRLVTLVDDCHLPEPVEALEVKEDRALLTSFLQAQGFRYLLNHMNERNAAPRSAQDFNRNMEE